MLAAAPAVVISFRASGGGHCRESLHLSFPMLVDAEKSEGHDPMPEPARQIKELQSQ